MTKQVDLDLFAEFPIPTYDEWRKVAEASLKGAAFDQKLLTKTLEGLTLEPMYQQRDVDDLHINERHVHPVKRKNGKWLVSQELNQGTPESFNRTAKNDLARGQTALHMVIDQTVRDGLSPVDQKGETGRTGLLLYNHEDMETALEGIDVSSVPIHLNGGAVQTPFLASLLAIAPTSLHGVVGADPIHEWVKKGSLSYSWRTVFDELSHSVQVVNERALDLKTILVQSHVYHNGGATATEELAFLLATGVQYVRALLERDIAIDDIGRSFCMSVSVGSDLFKEIAKLRALRLLWANIMEAFGAEKEGRNIWLHARTSFYTKTVYDPYVNMLRGTGEAFAAAVGGADSLHVSPFDEPIQKPSPFSRRIARNTSIILQEEAHIGQVEDPAAGSWYVEVLTEKLGEAAWSLFQTIESEGGMIASLEKGLPQQWVERSRQRQEQAAEVRKTVMVGTNRYVAIDEKPLTKQEEEPIAPYRKAIRTKQEKHLKASNYPSLLQAVKEGVPFSKLLTALQTKEAVPTIASIKETRLSMSYEALRKATEQWVKRTGDRPRVTLLTLGSLASHKPRADFARELFQVGGFQVDTTTGVTSTDEALRQLQEKTGNPIVLCGRDEDYESLAASLIEAVREAHPNAMILLAGNLSSETLQAYEQKGLYGTIHVRTNVFQFMNEVLMKRGVIRDANT
ncbi:methylmalonyl-CoA mutase family protein [Halalkalibacterium halodurans]|uniref:methylmalonyl-CoA mutase family protein n=1 Tax=Halalkalibacterium halodurans TaxID=86665 RepID=UPI0014199FFB|nr:methylmalonyl-CoA mutase family protein [Halalkalibacterium halodurans]